MEDTKVIIKMPILVTYLLMVVGMFRETIMKKMDTYWGSYHIHIFVFLTPLRIFVPCLEIIFCIDIFFYYVYLITVQVRALIMS